MELKYRLNAGKKILVLFLICLLRLYIMFLAKKEENSKTKPKKQTIKCALRAGNFLFYLFQILYHSNCKHSLKPITK